MDRLGMVLATVVGAPAAMATIAAHADATTGPWLVGSVLAILALGLLGVILGMRRVA